MCKLLKMIGVLFPFLLFSCMGKFESEQKMRKKNEKLCGLNELILNKTTINDIYMGYDPENVKEDIGWRPNIDSRYNQNYSKICDEVHWTSLIIDNYDKNFTHCEVELDFYNDTLVQISYRYKSENKKIPDFFVNKYGLGLPVTQDYLDSLHIGYGSMFDDACSYYNNKVIRTYRRYFNNDVHMVISGECWDVVICYVPKFTQLASAIDSVWNSSSKSQNTSVQTKGYNSMDSDDEEYWRSINRERELKDAGLDNAARIERKARQDYLRGGGYTSPEGGKQIHYQGSKEQKEHLEEMSRRGW